jgi:hypothetical protein
MSDSIHHKTPDAFFPHPSNLAFSYFNQQHRILNEQLQLTENIGYVENCTSSPIS